MGEINDGGPAFPQSDLSAYGMGPDRANNCGMSLRDWFAGQALVGEIANCGNESLHVNDGESIKAALARDAKRRAEWCYRQADAMLAARQAAQAVKP